MAGLIPQTFIDDLLDRVDIVDVVDARVKLRKSGKNYSACCPFHDEKTPSFTVSPDKQFYYCFGCGASGNAIGFVIDYDRLSFPEAVEQIARQCGLEVPRETREISPKERDRKSIYTLLEKADRFYRQQLRGHSSRSVAVNYLKGRGLSGEIARDFGIGYAPSGWDNLLRELGQNTGDRRLLIEGGMLINREEDQKCYDRFRHRIMFPIRDLRGRVIGFGGRVLGDDDAQGRASVAGGRMPGVTDAQGRASVTGGRMPGATQPKYLNSPETPVFHKGRELYGLYEARRAYRQLPRLLVVEGYMDVVALAQFGIRYAVATLGTACGEEHLNSAFRYTTEVVFCFDGDNAGRAAARRALEHALPVMQDGRQVKFLFLPEGEDPDTLVRKLGTDPFTRLIESAVPLEDFLFETVSQGIDIQFMEGRARLSKLAAPLLGRLPKGVFRELMFNSLASRTGLNVETLLELVDEAPPLRFNRTEGPAAKVEPGSAVPAAGDAYEPPPLEYPYEYLAKEPYREGYREQEPRPRLGPLPGKAHRAGVLQIKLPLEKRMAALLLQHPELAAEVQQPQSLLAGEGQDLAVLLSLIELLQQRPHYTISRILGYWRATYGARATDELAQLAASQLLHSARQFGYDPAAEFRDALNKIRTRQEKLHQRSVLEKLKHKAFNDVSAEEKQKVKDVYAGRSTPPE